MTQIAAKTSQVLNLNRSAIAPEMSATVMTAKVSWKPAATRNGTPVAAMRLCSSVAPCRPKYSNGLPTKPP